MESGVELIAIERKRQIEELGYDYTHDALYADEQLAKAGVCYALPVNERNDFEAMVGMDKLDTLLSAIWPWEKRFWKPTPEDRIKELSKAGALIAAQIDYFQRIKERELITKIVTEHKGPGTIVETKSGLKGRTYNSQLIINDKVQVHCVDGTKLLCSQENLKLIGFID